LVALLRGHGRGVGLLLLALLLLLLLLPAALDLVYEELRRLGVGRL
jgi:hypothetical protein